MKRFLPILFLTGCASVIDTPIYDARPATKQILIESPPSRVVYVGEITDKGRAFTKECLAQMSKKKYHNYKFNTATKLQTCSFNHKKEQDVDITYIGDNDE